MMLDHLGLNSAATAIQLAVAELLRMGGPRTPDLGGTGTTKQVGDAVLDLLK